VAISTDALIHRCALLVALACRKSAKKQVIPYLWIVDTPKIGTVNLIDKFTVRNEKKKI
jgi:hypothetical protein